VIARGKAQQNPVFDKHCLHKSHPSVRRSLSATPKNAAIDLTNHSTKKTAVFYGAAM
jgi:hypothetical protein